MEECDDGDRDRDDPYLDDDDDDGHTVNDDPDGCDDPKTPCGLVVDDV